MMAKSARFHNRKAGTHGRDRRAFRRGRRDQGIALLLSLMLLTLMSVMSVIMVMTVSPDMLINGYYGNFRGSFYAADSGLNMARQQLVNQVKGYVSMNACTGWVTNIPTGSKPLAARRRSTLRTAPRMPPLPRRMPPVQLSQTFWQQLPAGMVALLL